MGSRGYGAVGGIFDLVAHPDGSYLAFGYADDGSPYVPGAPSTERLDYFVSKFTSAGDTLRTYRFGQPGVDEIGTRLRLAPGGGAAVIGFRYRPNSAAAGYPKEGQVFLLDSLFRPQWSHTLQWTRSFDWTYNLLQPLASGEVLCGGLDYNQPALVAGFITKYAPTGTVQWVHTQQYQQQASGFKTMVNQADGSALLTGFTNTGTTSSTFRAYGYATYLTNLGIPYETDLCARPPRPYFAAAVAAAPAQVQVLDASAAGPRYGALVAWRWAWGDGTFSDGAAPGPHTYASPPPPGTAVALTVTNNLGCTATRTEYPFGPLATAPAAALAARLQVYPNPSSGLVTVELGGLVPQPPARLVLCNALGQAVHTALAPVRGGALSATLDVGDLPPGVYALRVTTREGTALHRLVRE